MLEIRRIAALGAAALIASLFGAARAPQAQQVPPPAPRAPAPSGELRLLQPLAADALQRAQLPSGGRIAVIVELQEQPLARYGGGRSGLRAPRPSAGARIDVRSAAARAYVAFLDGEISALAALAARAAPSARLVHRYRHVLGGAAMLVAPDELDALRRLPGVKAVHLARRLHLHTDTSVAFVGAPALWRALGGSERAGEGVVVGVLDTGIWPEHPSFADPDPSGRPYPAPPPTWKGAPCEFGSAVPGDAPFTCNRKLLGARRFLDEYESLQPDGLLPAEFRSARDDNGHGSHTASTAAGNAGVKARIQGAELGALSGVAPRAQLAVYKVCGALYCSEGDLVRAIDQAVADGVDVINYSISGGEDPYFDAVSLAFLDAHAAGVFVAASAGNSGPGAHSVAHREPWVTTVAATTAPRSFGAQLVLGAADGASLSVTGASIGRGLEQALPLVWAGDSGDPRCELATPDASFAGKIAICDRGINPRTAKSANAAARGALGVVLRNVAGGDDALVSDVHPIPALHIDAAAGAQLLEFVRREGVLGLLGPGHAQPAPGDVLAAFSSRGGPLQPLGIGKPDLAAPGVEILAAYTPAPADPADGAIPGQLFGVLQGTSMAAPHVSGAAALLLGLYPGWTPGQIHSALVTTAHAAVLDSDGLRPAGPFQVGAGRIDLARAGSPGLAISPAASPLQAADAFAEHWRELWRLNMPSIYLPVMPGRMRVSRRVHNLLVGETRWELSVQAPPDVRVFAPASIRVGRGAEASIELEIDARAVPEGEARSGALWLASGARRLRVPLALVRAQPRIALRHRCEAARAARWNEVQCEIRAVNRTPEPAAIELALALPRGLLLVPGSAEGALAHDGALAYGGELAAPPRPLLRAQPSTEGSSYVSLASLGQPLELELVDASLVPLSVAPFEFDGAIYSSVAMSSDGYLVVGGPTSAADYAPLLPASWPHGARPNAVLAPFWTALDPAKGGRYLAHLVGDGTRTWNVFEWQGVRNDSDGAPNTFQVWIGAASNGQGEDIRFTYGPELSAGSASGLSVGVENAAGTAGAALFHGGRGTPPSAAGPDVLISSQPGGEHVVRYRALAWRRGAYPICAELRSPAFDGTHTACAALEVQ